MWAGYGDHMAAQTFQKRPMSSEDWFIVALFFAVAVPVLIFGVIPDLWGIVTSTWDTLIHGIQRSLTPEPAAVDPWAPLPQAG